MQPHLPKQDSLNYTVEPRSAEALGMERRMRETCAARAHRREYRLGLRPHATQCGPLRHPGLIGRCARKRTLRFSCRSTHPLSNCVIWHERHGSFPGYAGRPPARTSFLILIDALFSPCLSPASLPIARDRRPTNAGAPQHLPPHQLGSDFVPAPGDGIENAPDELRGGMETGPAQISGRRSNRQSRWRQQYHHHSHIG